MSQPFKLDGIKLPNSGVAIALVTDATHTQSYMVNSDQHRGGVVEHSAGGANAVVDITFTFLGNGINKHLERDFVHGRVGDKGRVWTLEAKGGYAVYRGRTRMPLRTMSVSGNDANSHGKLTLTVRASVQGSSGFSPNLGWIADGGAYCELLRGTFRRTASAKYLDGEGVTWNGAPLIELPEQTTGYPLARRHSDGVMAQPPLHSLSSETTRDGKVRLLERYDLTDFLTDPLDDAGDGGAFRVCSSPSTTFLDGGEDMAFAGGIGSKQVASFQVGDP